MSWKIPQVLPWLGSEEAEAVAGSVHDNWITEGPKAGEFSEMLNTNIGVPHGVFAPNGTLALALGLMALDIGHGDQVLVPDTTFIGSATAVLMIGAIPVFVEVNPGNFQIDVSKAEHLVCERTRAIMPVHLYGMSCNMNEVTTFAERHNLAVIEDAAQGIGVTYNGKPVGGLGTIGCFSFFADKTITTGEGGYVTTRDPAIAEKLLYLRNQGRLDRGSFVHPAIGFNFRMTDLQAGIGVVQINKLDEIISRKTRILEWYRAGLEGVDEVRFLALEPGSNRVPFRVVLLCDNVQDLSAHLEDKGVQVRGFFYPLHKQPCFQDLALINDAGVSLDDMDYPNAIYGSEHGICLPVHPTLSREEVGYVTDAVQGFYTT